MLLRLGQRIAIIIFSGNELAKRMLQLCLPRLLINKKGVRECLICTFIQPESELLLVVLVLGLKASNYRSLVL